MDPVQQQAPVVGSNQQLDPTEALQDLTDRLGELEGQVGQTSGIVRRVQNVAGVGSGSTMPIRVQGGIGVRPVKGVKAASLAVSGGIRTIAVLWHTPDPRLATPVDHYEVYGTGLQAANTAPVLLAAATSPPAIFNIPSTGNTVVLTVTTVMSNGQALPLKLSPTTTIVA